VAVLYSEEGMNPLPLKHSGRQSFSQGRLPIPYLLTQELTFGESCVLSESLDQKEN